MHKSPVDTMHQYVLKYAGDVGRLDACIPNILRAADYMEGEQLIETMVVLTGLYLQQRGNTDLLERLNKAIKKAEAVEHEALGFLHGKRGNILADRGEFGPALEDYQAAYDLAADDQFRRAILVARMGRVLVDKAKADQPDLPNSPEKFREARAKLDQAYEIISEHPDDRALVFVLEQESVYYGETGESEKARETAMKGIALIKKLGQPQGLLGNLFYLTMNLGSAEQKLGLQQGIDTHLAALKIAEEIGSAPLMAYAHYALGDHFTELKKRKEAKAHLVEALAIGKRSGLVAISNDVTKFMNKHKHTTARTKGH